MAKGVASQVPQVHAHYDAHSPAHPPCPTHMPIHLYQALLSLFTWRQLEQVRSKVLLVTQQPPNISNISKTLLARVLTPTPCYAQVACGQKQVDFELLKENTVYKNGLDAEQVRVRV